METFSCPECATGHNAPEEWCGKLVRCESCGTRFSVPGDRKRAASEVYHEPRLAAATVLRGWCGRAAAGACGGLIAVILVLTLADEEQTKTSDSHETVSQVNVFEPSLMQPDLAQTDKSPISHPNDRPPSTTEV